MNKKTIKRPCPKCGRLVDFSSNLYRPFCSKRCKLADLGSWLKEEYYISTSFFELTEERDMLDSNFNKKVS